MAGMDRAWQHLTGLEGGKERGDPEMACRSKEKQLFCQRGCRESGNQTCIKEDNLKHRQNETGCEEPREDVPRHQSTQALLGRTMRALLGDSSMGRWFWVGDGSLGPQLLHTNPATPGHCVL